MQAYALCRYLTELGFSVEQICFQARPEPVSLKGKCKSWIAGAIYRFSAKGSRQNAALRDFRNHDIPHSDSVFTESSIGDCRGYDAYITGSDQVWNLDHYKSEYFLPFVPSGAKKIAYAASIGQNKITEQQAVLFQMHLSDFSAISVRERDAVDMLSPLAPVPVEWTLDPVFLLTREHWDEICEKRLVESPYLFCYFLGKSKLQRELAVEFAKKRNLKVVSISYVRGTPRKCDMKFGDRCLSGISPKGFLSLVKYADYVFTDSFHATAFSELYRIPYAAFRRDGRDSMTSRIYSMTTIFEDPERFCDADEKESIAYIEQLLPMEQREKFPLFEDMRERSCRFLRDSLHDIV